ncbi:DNA recombination protein RmuC [Pseudoroseicyclus aestuarii]|uniref:DNA recombination protein RmuC homolog n=1 Tax=Pseudoroseicyclus aestuarii TaxID=1795041 RepID=A0A318T1R1_9RHOB|nr:DNA recombination protein RmuC [Pseudoroseicyclus aestuarii]PYE85917.1 DNA recombination protein RmuC [Pseudoroseicyclus aestuarii]
MPDLSLLLLAALGLVLLCLCLAALAGLRTARAEVAGLRRGLEEAQERAHRHAALADARETRLSEMTDEIAAARGDLREERAAHAATSEQGARSGEAAEALRRTEARLSAELADLRGQHRDLQERHNELQRDHAALSADTEGKLASAEERLKEFREMREKMRAEFEQLAQGVLRSTGSDLSKAHGEKLTELLTPFRDHVSRFETELRQVHGKADEERARLGEQIRMLTVQSENVRTEAANLTRALKGEKQKQGAWGEMILERILEASGLERGTHYVVQESRTDAEGARWRPDVVVKMPREKSLVIDSKVSLVSYEAAVNAEEEAERARHMKDHVLSVRRHIDQLAAKGYHALDAGSVDYVLMFMPIEGALSAALAEAGDLTAYAVARGVGVMTPSTLMVTLRTVDHIWTVERRESNAEDIAIRAGRLYDKVAGFVTDMEKVGGALGQAARAHEDAMGKLSQGRGNVLGQIDKLKVMGARTTKSLPTSFDADDDDEDAAQPTALLGTEG